MMEFTAAAPEQGHMLGYGIPASVLPYWDGFISLGLLICAVTASWLCQHCRFKSAILIIIAQSRKA